MTTQYIETKYKDCPPEQTVETIRKRLAAIGIELEETVRDAGIGNVYSVHVAVKGGYPLLSNGKGITVELARASAYAEFIERLQCGLFLYKFQSIARDREMDLQSYAPDGRYMTVKELEESGEWMDYVIATYGNGLTRSKLAQQCRMYANTDEDKILTLPFYSLFENKYVYLPAGFVEHIYSANGCCAGNTRQEAWVHAFSEMLERNSTIRMLTGNCAAPVIPDQVLAQYPVPAAILKKIRQTGNYDVTLFDFSQGNGFPVIGVRLINKTTQGYLVNTAADPIFEIALSRGLTEIFQGQSLESISSLHGGSFWAGAQKIPVAHNVLNQIENGNGLFPLPFFTEEVSAKTAFTGFDDNRGKDNSALLAYVTELYRKMGRPVYVRNYSFLGFPSYQFVVPGFSETRGFRLTEPVQEYALADASVKVFHDPAQANAIDRTTLMMLFAKKQTALSHRGNFGRLAGLPIQGDCAKTLLYMTMAYTACKLERYADAIGYIDAMLHIDSKEPNCLTGEDKALFRCYRFYLDLKKQGIGQQDAGLLLKKFFDSTVAAKLMQCIADGQTPFDAYLLQCDKLSCAQCRYAENCNYTAVKHHIGKAGNVYARFTQGQDRSEFTI